MVRHGCGCDRKDRLMGRGSLFKSLVCLGICVLFAEACRAGSTTGFQWWSTVNFRVDINNEWFAAFEEELRLGDNLCYHHSDIGLTYEGLADWLDVGFNFRKAYQRDSDGDWQEENRPHFNITVKDTFAGIKWSTRSRFEFRDRQGREDIWRYRNRLRLEMPWELTALNIKPYVSEEVLINMDGSGFSSNRLIAGGVLALTKNVKLDLYYLWQATKTGSGFDDVHALGTKLMFQF
jgi:hypothetical protein